MTKKLTVILPADTMKALRIYCAQREMKIQDAVNLSILKTIETYNEMLERNHATITTLSRNIRSFLDSGNQRTEGKS